MTNVDKEYARLVADCLEGSKVKTRNSVCYRLNKFGASGRSDTVMFDSTPLVGVRKTAWKNAIREFEWFLSGSNRIEDLHQSVRDWWTPWADKGGRVKYNYSVQMRDFVGRLGCGFDQIEYLVESVKNHPNSRRAVMTTWNAADMAEADCPITNCHNTMTMLTVDGDFLHMETFQRSCDLVCGVPHNWIQQAAFHLWLAARTHKLVGCLKWTGGDIHVYEEHEAVARRIIESTGIAAPTPTLTYRPTSEQFRADDFALSGDYQPVFSEKARMIV